MAMKHQWTSLWPEDFSGEVAIFPLPDVVLFPGTVLPLHLFEPRYCQMLQDSLGENRLIAMGTLQAGWESHHGKPPFASVAGIGQVIAHDPLPDGRHHILLHGMQRCYIVEELPQNRPYRMVRVQLIASKHPSDRYLEEPLRAKLLKQLHAMLDSQAGRQLPAPLEQLPLDALSDWIAQSFDFPMDQKLRWLATGHVFHRADLISQYLVELGFQGDLDTQQLASGRRRRFDTFSLN